MTARLPPLVAWFLLACGGPAEEGPHWSEARGPVDSDVDVLIRDMPCDVLAEGLTRLPTTSPAPCTVLSTHQSYWPAMDATVPASDGIRLSLSEFRPEDSLLALCVDDQAAPARIEKLGPFNAGGFPPEQADLVRVTPREPARTGATLTLGVHTTCGSFPLGTWQTERWGAPTGTAPPQGTFSFRDATVDIPLGAGNQVLDALGARSDQHPWTITVQPDGRVGLHFGEIPAWSTARDATFDDPFLTVVLDDTELALPPWGEPTPPPVSFSVRTGAMTLAAHDGGWAELWWDVCLDAQEVATSLAAQQHPPAKPPIDAEDACDRLMSFGMECAPCREGDPPTGLRWTRRVRGPAARLTEPVPEDTDSDDSDP